MGSGAGGGSVGGGAAVAVGGSVAMGDKVADGTSTSRVACVGVPVGGKGSEQADVAANRTATINSAGRRFFTGWAFLALWGLAAQCTPRFSEVQPHGHAMPQGPHHSLPYEDH